MVYIEEKNILKADTLRFKFIGPHTIIVNDDKELVTVIDIDSLYSEISLTKHIMIVTCLSNISSNLNKEVSVEEIDKFILNNYREVESNDTRRVNM